MIFKASQWIVGESTKLQTYASETMVLRMLPWWPHSGMKVLNLYHTGGLSQVLQKYTQQHNQVIEMWQEANKRKDSSCIIAIYQ